MGEVYGVVKDNSYLNLSFFVGVLAELWYAICHGLRIKPYLSLLCLCKSENHNIFYEEKKPKYSSLCQSQITRHGFGLFVNNISLKGIGHSSLLNVVPWCKRSPRFNSQTPLRLAALYAVFCFF